MRKSICYNGGMDKIDWDKIPKEKRYEMLDDLPRVTIDGQEYPQAPEGIRVLKMDLVRTSRQDIFCSNPAHSHPTTRSLSECHLQARRRDRHQSKDGNSRDRQ